MLIPRYFFANDYEVLYSYFLSQPHKRKSFIKNEYLWSPGEPIKRVYYIESGITQTSVIHEDGYQKILFFHSNGTVFPGCHQSVFKIESSIVTRALSPLKTLEFNITDFYKMFQENRQLSSIAFESYAMYINLLIYETAHQEYNNSFIKLCNLLYLFAQHSTTGKTNKIDLTQAEIAEILTINRVNAAKSLSILRDKKIIVPHRRWIEIIDFTALEAYCSLETLQP